MDFFTGILFKLINAKRLDIEDSILVVCGGQYDANCLRDANIKNITLSNLDVERQIGYDCKWSHQDAESLTFPDASFDWVIVNAGLHHCASPHRALLEMFRTCKKGVILVEARDSAFNRLAVKMNLSSEFELEAVVLEGGKSGGVRNTAVPNYIYRWTEREVIKAIESNNPQSVNSFQFFYGLIFPHARIAMSPARIRVLKGLIRIVAKCVYALFPSQGNKFGAVIFKTGKFKPWMDENGTHIRKDYALGFDHTRWRSPN